MMTFTQYEVAVRFDVFQHGINPDEVTGINLQDYYEQGMPTQTAADDVINEYLLENLLPALN